MSEKQTKIKKLQLEIEIKDKIISGLVHIIAENKIKIPENLLDVISKLYPHKEKNNAN